MRHHLNHHPAGGDMSTPYGRVTNVLGQVEQLLRSIADVHTATQAQTWARQGLELIATLDRVDAADPDISMPRYPSESVDHAAELRIELMRAETGAPWGGGL